MREIYRDKKFLDEVFSKEKIDGVIHFAASSQVGESMTNPLKYYNNNLCGTEVLLRYDGHGIDKIVFSSMLLHMEELRVFLFWKQTEHFQLTVMERQSFLWRRCLSGLPKHII